MHLRSRMSCLKQFYNSLNPMDNAAIGTIIGCFQDSSNIGKIQQGSAWWFNDHKTGMTDQMTSLANLGLLSNFVGTRRAALRPYSPDLDPKSPVFMRVFGLSSLNKP